MAAVGDGAGGTDKQAALIVNTHAKRGQKAFEEAKKLLTQAGFAVDAYSVEDPDRLKNTIAEALGKGHRFVVLGGGDGTISSSVDAFVGSEAVLGVLPLGTANSFAKSLGMPFDLPEAVKALARGKVATIDLGKIGDRHFTNVLSIGLQTAIAGSVSPGLKRVLGRGAYLLAAAKEVWRFEPFRCRLVLDGETKEFPHALEIRIANGPFKGGVLAAPEAGLESGDLVIHVVKGKSSLTLGRAWGAIMAGKRPDPSVMGALRARTLRLETVPPQDVSVDGEVAARTPVEVTVVPKALRVIVGERAAGTSMGTGRAEKRASRCPKLFPAVCRTVNPWRAPHTSRRRS